ncbi:putative selenate reductase subunit YgfK [Anaerocolumna aminovalerica]|jgi:putative selenate reductase|uniref:Putative selenate reductase n=1 Tax=Anaerocolumna aminovalerica TaxID=1527 RepID=A0A1I5E6X5_9FIRM|nr:putative selenate reductase subunit YgfK [Anaerocolumna aminovalerica]MDU6263381.1 putative selenate reductase subunit YgfK [Anaerocolumna aminovalerica]SFO06871.1 putative selenate reductase [Anaerocolumna aminovalerica]
MSDRMTPIPFDRLMNWILEEKKNRNTVFGVRKAYVAKEGRNLDLFDEKLETPFGPAAGPHTQLAQNLVASYYAGSRFFELKTVQVLDGEDLPVAKPCITAEDECYNCEWSTELRVPEAFDEYVKAWFAIKVIAKEFKLGSPDGFMFNMSVGYDLEGIKTKKIDDFIEGLKEAKDTSIFKECKEYLLNNINLFKNITEEDVNAITSNICTSITLSTLHGCPPQEIERIASYLINEKHVNTFIKCNPTLLGYEFARKTLDDMGYDYIAFGDFHFKDDLQYEDAIPMLKRLMALADEKGLSFGVKITNTFPVDVKAGELPSEEMYMSGRSLYPLSIALAAKLSKEFDGKLRISYSGGADVHNIDKIYESGIWPITIATTVLKPGGYERMVQIAKIFDKEEYKPFSGINPEAVEKLQKDSITDPNHTKAIKPLPSRKMERQVPLLDCFEAPCKQGCPIHQDITSYLKLAGEGKYLEALKVIVEKNPLPFITGTICAHNCMSKCTRNFYEESVQIRSVKLEAAQGGFEDLMKELKAPAVTYEGKTAVIGGGPAGLATAFFLARSGMKVTIFEKRETLGGVIRHIIPGFRIPDEAIQNDIELAKIMGVEIKVNSEVTSIDEIKNMGYDNIVLAIGASKPGVLKLEEGEAMNALAFLEDFKKSDGNVDLGKNVVVIGGGNTAMDTARAAKRTEGVEKVSLVYRRTKRYMPADEEELILTLEDGVEFRELLAPYRHEDGMLLCHKMILGDPDASGRRKPVETDEIVKVPADTVIAAVGEKADINFYKQNNITINEKGYPVVDPVTAETNVKGVFVAGDGLYGPATVVEAIRDARKAAEGILGKEVAKDIEADLDIEALYAKRGIIKKADEEGKDSGRCLGCSSVCENCVEVCPNRANISIRVPGMALAQILHVDKMCNECGNCETFCPYDSAPYKEKFTLFNNTADFEDSTNEGFVLVDKDSLTFQVRLGGKVTTVKGLKDTGLYDGIEQFIAAVYNDYSYLF